MAYREPHSDTKKVFMDIFDSSTISNLINVRILTDNNQKKVPAKPNKTSNLTKHLTGIDIIITVNEDVFELMPEHHQIMIADEVMAGIGYNHNTEKVILDKPDYQTYHMFLNKYGYENHEILLESIKTQYQVIKDREEQGHGPVDVGVNESFVEEAIAE